MKINLEIPKCGLLVFISIVLGSQGRNNRRHRDGLNDRHNHFLSHSQTERHSEPIPPTPSNCSSHPEENSSLLWRIDTSPPSYFFGTIHVPYTRVWNSVPAHTKEAFHSSSKVYFELDLTNPYTIAALTSCQLLPRGLNLSQVLPPDVYRRLSDHLQWVKGEMKSWVTADQSRRGLYADYLFNAITANWERKRPIWAMLMVNGLTPSDIASRGFPVLDLFLAQKAKNLNKLIGAVERVEEQCRPLNGLTYGQVIFALNQTLQQHEDIRFGRTVPQYTTDDLIRNYKCGNIDSIVFNQDTAQVPLLASTVLSDQEAKIASEIDSYFKDQLIYIRNRRMGARVVELLLNNPGSSFFFAFGAGHFVGDKTIVDVVRKAGFKVEQVPANEGNVAWQKGGNNGRFDGGGEDRDSGGGIVKGTFDDLSDDEKTKAFLKLLEYKLRKEHELRIQEQQEKERKENSFHELWQKLPALQVDPIKETEEERMVRQSIQVWYGINGVLPHYIPSTTLSLVLLVLALIT